MANDPASHNLPAWFVAGDAPTDKLFTHCHGQCQLDRGVEFGELVALGGQEQDVLALYRRSGPDSFRSCPFSGAGILSSSSRLGVLHLLNPYKPEILRMRQPEQRVQLLGAQQGLP